MDVIEYAAYCEAANQLGLLVRDHHCDSSLHKAGEWQTGNQLFHMFAIILKYNPPAEPKILWEDHFYNLSDY